MGLKECNITLDNPWDAYCPGQTLNGIVEYTFDAPKTIKDISIKFKGRGNTSWSETTSHKDSHGKSVRRTTHYSGDEEYFATSIYLIRPSSGDEMELPAGKHTYPFSFTLPNSLPSSFEGTYGFIRYTIKSTLNRPWKFNMDTKLPFTIISHLDLNSDPDYKLPIHIHLKKHYGCFCCKSGPLLLDFNLPVSGYCSGQAIPIDVSCENGSNVHIDNFKVELRKTVRFHSKRPTHKTKTEKSLIATLSLGQLTANSSKDWREYMQVPELPPSNLEDCGIIDLDYNIKITCTPSGCHANSNEKKTIILGTVPFVGFDCLPPGPSPMPVQAPEVSNWQSKAEFPLLPSLTPMLPPPIMQQLPFPSAPMMPQSSLGPDRNMFPYPPYDAPPPFQGQSMGIIHGEKNRITSTLPYPSMGITHDGNNKITSPPPFQGQSSMGITHDGNNKITSPPPFQGQSSMGITHDGNNKITSPPPFQGQSSMGIIQDGNDRITSPPPYEGGQSSMGTIHQDGIDHNARISPAEPPPAIQEGQSSTGMTQDEIDHQNRIGIPPPYSSFAGYSYPYQ